MDTIKTVEYRQSYPVLQTYDVIVCGGGPAGFVAAIAAARNGARTAIVEQLNFFGGLATAGYVAPVSRFNQADGSRAIGGIPWEVMTRLEQLGAADLSYKTGNVPFDTETYKYVIQKMLEEAGVAMYLDCRLVGCEMDESRIRHILCASRHGHFALAGSCFVDCTGDAELCQFSGVPFHPIPDGSECQPATMCFRLANVDTDHLENIHLSEPDTRYFNARVRDLLTSLEGKEDVPNFGGPWFCWGMRDGVVHVNITRSQTEFKDPLKSSQIACQLRENVIQFVNLLRRHFKEFKNCYLMDTGTLIGYREGHRIMGAHTLTGEELINAVHFDDAIAATTNPVDMHNPTDSSQKVIFLKAKGYIPYRTMYNPAYPNLLAAGRCLSADRLAFAAVRVQAPCMATGEAAGTAAAMACAANIPVSQVNIRQLQQKLASSGLLCSN